MVIVYATRILERDTSVGRGQLKCDGTRAETRFRLSAKRTSPFKSAGRQFSRLLAAEVYASAVVMLYTPCSEVVWRVLATHYIRQFPLHFPSRASPCAITFQLESTTTKILAGRQRNVTISHGGKWTFFSPKRPDQHRDQSNYLFNWQGSYFPGLKWQRLEADHLLPYSAKDKNAWHFTFIFPHAFTTCEGS